MATLKVTITPEDFRNAPEGYRNTIPESDCVLAMALKRAYPEKKVYVSAFYLKLDETPYKIPVEWGMTKEDEGWNWSKIDKLSSQAKKSLEGIPTIELELKDIKEL